MSSTWTKAWLLALAFAAGACGGTSTVHHDLASPDGGGSPSMAGPLVLSIELKAANVQGLTVTSGKLEFERVSLFGDVAADMRTMTNHAEMKLPSDDFDTTFTAAPYGLYSRVQAKLDDFHVEGTWNGVPLVYDFEVDDTSIDVRGPALDYEPESGAHFVLAIDSSAWFDPNALNGAAGAGTPGGIRVDYFNNQVLILGIISAIQGSFQLTESPTQ